MNEIKVSDILKLDDLKKYKLHLAGLSPDGMRPLDGYARNWDEWVEWNEWKGNKNDFSKQFVFTLIKYYHEKNKWLFGGIFEIKERLQNTYVVELKNIYKELIGRLIVDFHRYQGLLGRAFNLENQYAKFKVSQILKKAYDGVVFPGYENINIDFTDLEQVYKIQKNYWKTALENVKGIYVIVDKLNGKKYVGSAYGDFGIWSRWACYIGTGHGWNDELTKLIKQKGIEYAKSNFKFTLLEYRSMKTDNNVVIGRESFWKDALNTKGNFGYNKNKKVKL